MWGQFPEKYHYVTLERIIHINEISQVYNTNENVHVSQVDSSCTLTLWSTDSSCPFRHVGKVKWLLAEHSIEDTPVQHSHNIRFLLNVDANVCIS